VNGADDLPDDATCGTGGLAEKAVVVDALTRTNELIDYLCPGEDLPLSTAAHLSARFPYVSPIARVPAGDCDGTRPSPDPGHMPDSAISYVTDGGVADNSGASTAMQIWRAVRPTAAEGESGDSCVIPIFVQIDNSIGDESGDASSEPPLELIAPGSALLSRFGGQEASERSEARQEFATVRTAGGRTIVADRSWFRIAPSVQPGIQPPLGWTLAPDTVADMRRQMLSEGNRQSMVQLRQLLAAPPRCPVPAGAAPTGP
jgi:hypothetical protein